ncbi:hypothetical protein DUNSADRAFT_4584 [Dunaliella salina]|uniref:Uncharacterized protein n=1 Tax=Dunaliella salina TaxID=3046 RepID=A0ABQ7GRQ0_DUNSA|nr:hypothetical protein DUNSADRAFT_4584 [Dunaliella salina]|eukprot:KAF5837258.1 hypothetical protein DUNSADRAFT_4584 [Dunaliella salina]
MRSTIAVSLRSKGLSSFATSNWWTRLRGHLVGVALECSDIIVSAILTWYNLSWTGWIAVGITILAAAINLHTKNNPGVGSMFLPLFAFYVLPLVVMFYLTVTRRDAAQHALGRLKAQVVALSLQAQAVSLIVPAMGFQGVKPAAADATALTTPEGSPRGLKGPSVDAMDQTRLEAAAAAEELRQHLSIMLDDLHRISRDIGVLQRRLHYSLREVMIGGGAFREALAATAGMGSGDKGLAGLMSTCTLVGQQVVALHESIEQLCVYKELRTPVMMRAMLRWSTTIIIPVFNSYFWNSFELNLSKAVLGVLAVLCQTALMVVVDVAMSLEDPFDDSALDALSLFESLSHISAMADAVEPKPELDGGLGSKEAAQARSGSFNVVHNREFGRESSDTNIAQAQQQQQGSPSPLATNSVNNQSPMARYKPSPHVIVAAPPMPLPPTAQAPGLGRF